MDILLATPWFSSHLDSGLFWAAALSRLHHTVALWDYCQETEPPRRPFNSAIAIKGNITVARKLHRGSTKVACYWPDDFLRTPELLVPLLEAYDVVATPVCPTPDGCMWLPTGWDPLYHKPWPAMHPPVWNSLTFGTYTPRKLEFLRIIKPSVIFGNGWGPSEIPGAIYGPDLVSNMSVATVLVNIHRDPIGVNRRLFEMIACGFTITDLVPGVEEILGRELALKVGFTTPEEGKERLDYFLAHPEEREALWEQEKKAIAPYTYEAQAAKLLKALGL